MENIEAQDASNTMKTKSRRVVHMPKIYDDFFLEKETEYGGAKNKVRYPLCNQVSYHRIHEDQKNLLQQISSHTKSNSFSKATLKPI